MLTTPRMTLMMNDDDDECNDDFNADDVDDGADSE